MGTHYQGTSEERRALDLYIKLSRAAESVNQRVNRHLQDAHLTVSQFAVLEAIYHLGPLTPGQLCDKILRSTGNLTLVIDNLEKRKLVARHQNPEDRRSTLVELTTAGRELIAALLPVHVQTIVQDMAVLSPAEQEQLAALCRKLGLQIVI